MTKEKNVILSITTDEELVDVFMPIKLIPGEELPMGYKKADIVYRRVGIKKQSGVIVKGTKEFAKKYATMLDTEARTALREKRCLVEDGKGGYIRCPESNHCVKCKKKDKDNFNTLSPLSFEQLTQSENEEDKVFDFADGNVNVEEDAMAFVMLDNLISYLKTFEDESLARIFQMLYNQNTVQEIADELGVPWSTAKDAVNRVRKLVQKHITE